LLHLPDGLSVKPMFRLPPVWATFLEPKVVGDLAYLVVTFGLGHGVTHFVHGAFCRTGQVAPGLIGARLNLLPGVLARGGNVFKELFRLNALVMQRLHLIVQYCFNVHFSVPE